MQTREHEYTKYIDQTQTNKTQVFTAEQERVGSKTKREPVYP